MLDEFCRGPYSPCLTSAVLSSILDEFWWVLYLTSSRLRSARDKSDAPRRRLSRNGCRHPRKRNGFGAVARAPVSVS
eukprot:6273189-Pyramimonas_sp.AAC.1